MSSRDFSDILNDCVDRMARGQSVEACLRLYPAEAERLRPLLQAGVQVRRLLPEAAELRADQSIVWQQLQPRLESGRFNRRRRPGIGRLLLAAALLTGLLGGAWLALNRPWQQDNIIEMLVNSETPTVTPFSSLTSTPIPTDTPSPVPSATSTATSTSTPTPSETASATPIPTVPPPTSTLLPPTVVPLPTIRTDNSGPGSANSGSGSGDDDDSDHSGSGHDDSDDHEDDDNSGHGSSDDD